MSDDRRFELPDDVAPEEERAIIRALERYFAQESPHPDPWVLAGRLDATAIGALQSRHHTGDPWALRAWVPFARRGVPPQGGRGDAG